MTWFHHTIKNGKKSTAVEHRMYNVRGGKKYEGRDDLLYTAHRNIPNDDPDGFWRAADKHERSNGTAYREHEIAIPSRLPTDAQIRLAERLAERLVPDRPYELAIHCRDSSIEGLPNPHVHIMFSDRKPDGIERPLAQIFMRANSQHPERGGRKKDSGGRDRQQMKELALALRETVADTINAALAEAGLDDRVDHRSLRQQGVTRKPERHLGPATVKGMTPEDKAGHVGARRELA